MAFPTPKLDPELTLLPFRIKNIKNNLEKFDSSLSNDKTLLWSFSNQQLPVAKSFVYKSGMQM